MPWKPFSVLVFSVATLVFLFSLLQFFNTYRFHKYSDNYYSLAAGATQTGQIEAATGNMLAADHDAGLADEYQKEGIISLIISASIFWGAFYSRKKAKMQEANKEVI